MVPLTLDGDVGLDALDNGHVQVTEVLHLVPDSAAGVALALTILLADALRLALFAHFRLAVQLCERRLLSASQGQPPGRTANAHLLATTATRSARFSGRRTHDLPQQASHVRPERLGRTEPRRRSGYRGDGTALHRRSPVAAPFT